MIMIKPADCPGVCEFHMNVQKEIDSKVAKSSVIWMATIFSIPILVAIFSAWAFMSAADYKYGSIIQAKDNAANIKLLDERIMHTRQDISLLQTNVTESLLSLKADIRSLAMDVRHGNDINNKKPKQVIQ